MTALPYVKDSATSAEAAERAEPRAGTHRAYVLNGLRAVGALGATDEEMQEGLEMDPSSQRPRRIELVRAGLIEDSGMTRKTLSGRKATVWRAVPAKEAT